MSTQYRIYQNNSAGGPVDEGTVVATVSGLTWDTPPLPLSSDTTFLLRAFDTVTGLEEKNTDARVRIRIDAAGLNISARPNAPTGLTVQLKPGGGVQVLWLYNQGGQGAAPTGFRVYVGSPTPDYGTIAATWPYAEGRGTFAASLTGLADGDYQAGVRSYNATGEEANILVADFTIDATGPDPVEDLAATATP